MLPFLIDTAHDYHLFKGRFEKILRFKDSNHFSDLTKAEKALVNEQIAAMETLLNILKKRINLY
jgi:hypothetical protein